MNEQALAAARGQPTAYLAAKLTKLREADDWAAVEVVATVLAERQAPAVVAPRKTRYRSRRLTAAERIANRVDGYDRDDC